MNQTASIHLADAIDRSFWENDLQMCLDPWLAHAKDKIHVRKWVGELTKRQLRVLCANLGLNGDGKLQEQREALLQCDGQLVPYFLVDRFAYRRSKFATADFAESVLAAETVEECRIGEGIFDTLALLFAMYHREPAHLRTVYHLEKIHSTGFARMKLKGHARRPENETFKEFLTPQVVERALAQFDTDRGDGRSSEFKNIVPHADHHLVFIRREERRTLVLKSHTAIHGFNPEWIVLDFREDGKGVDISSLSMSVPLEIANRLASAYFGRKCEYENEIQVTYKEQIVKFVDALRKDGCDFLALVEMTVRNSPLDGAAGVRLHSEDSESIAESVRHFEKAIGKIADDIDHIQSIKVLYVGKRVKLLFEPVEGVNQGYVVRYQDQVLNAKERRAFEAKLGEEPYGLRVLSTEKRHKK
jgi:hypothetical protein